MSVSIAEQHFVVTRRVNGQETRTSEVLGEDEVDRARAVPDRGILKGSARDPQQRDLDNAVQRRGRHSACLHWGLPNSQLRLRSAKCMRLACVASLSLSHR